MIQVEVPTHVAGIIEFASGAVGTILTSFDVWAAELPRIEIYGSEGTLSLPDPNTFAGPVRLRLAADQEFRELDLVRPYAENCRGLGVADLGRAWQAGSNDQRASGDLALHVLETMHLLHESASQGRHQQLQSSFLRPRPLDPQEVF